MMFWTNRHALKVARAGYQFLKYEGLAHHLNVQRLHRNAALLDLASPRRCALSLAYTGVVSFLETPYSEATEEIRANNHLDEDAMTLFIDNHGFDVDTPEWLPTGAYNWLLKRSYTKLNAAWRQVLAENFNDADADPVSVTRVECAP